MLVAAGSLLGCPADVEAIVGWHFGLFGLMSCQGSSVEYLFVLYNKTFYGEDCILL